MLEAGLHFGHRTIRFHPKMAPFVYTKKDGILFIDLVKTLEKLKEALDFVKKVVEEKKQILFVGTKIQAQEIIKQTAEECGMPYITRRWLGGTLTNFATIKKRILYYQRLKELLSSEEIQKYTKKERLFKERELERLSVFFEGISSLLELPSALFVIDPHYEDVAVREANKVGIPVIALIDVNGDPEKIAFPIPGNDDSRDSIEYIVSKISEATLKTKNKEEKIKKDEKRTIGKN